MTTDSTRVTVAKWRLRAASPFSLLKVVRTA
jgi:hypothetical protein